MTRAFDADDAWHLAAGTHTRLWEIMGAHPHDAGATFRVWAPNAASVSVISDRNGWQSGSDPLDPDPSGVWRGTFGGYTLGDHYKFSITSGDGVHVVAKSDPFARASQVAPGTASIIAVPSHDWTDAAWMADRGERNSHAAPISTYEVHLGSWRYEPGGYTALARQLADYCVDMGFTHVELLPVMEHPFYGSWGYQTTGYFAPTARYGSPDDVMRLVDILHQSGVGVILDWVPSHFPTDEASLGFFDGTHLYEHADPKQGFHPDWKSFVFNYGRPEVRSFLLSSAHFWLDQYHADGVRVDAVASMLYLDYSRSEGEWVPNVKGGNENLEAVAFLQELNRSVYAAFPGVVMIAEESTAWPGVTNPTDMGGLGFGFKWDMGWMHDTLEYLSNDAVHRRWHHDRITFRSVYQASENYVLPLSHDEVVHGKGSLLDKMPGDRWQQFANLRLLFGYQWTVPGKKLLFMGGEFGSPSEWSHEAELPWPVLGDAAHAGVQGWVRRLNELYAELGALHRVDRDPDGFRWVVNDDREQSVLAYLRLADGDDPVLVVMNNTPEPRRGYRLGVPAGTWELVASSDDVGYGGSGAPARAECTAAGPGSHDSETSIELDLPPLAIVIYRGRPALT
jgi:1,4-alpha-glucan branching enzyme